MKKIFTLLLLVYSSVSFAQSLKISQVYGAGGNSGAVYTSDYIELFNPTSNPINVNDWSVQYNSATSTTTTWQKTKLPNVTIQPGHYFLIQESTGTGGTTPLPTADVTGTIAMSGTAGKVILVSDTNFISIACPTTNVIDKVGYGITATCFEGSGPTVASGGNTNSFFRANNGCNDTDNNTADFTPAAAAPRNSASPVNNCGGGPSPSIIANPTTIADFGNVNVGSNSVSASFTITGANLIGFPGNINIAGSSNFQVSNDNSSWGISTTIPFTSATLTSTTVYVRFTPQSGGALGSNVSIVGGGISTTVLVAVSGTGVAIVPTLGATALTGFGNVCANATSVANSFNLNGVNLTNANITVGPLNNFTFSTTAAGTYSASLTLTQTGGTYSQDIFVKFTPTAIQAYTGGIPVSGGGAANAIGVPISGAGVNSAPSLTADAATNISYTSATLPATVTDNGCTALTSYGFEYSITNGFANGSGTVLASTNISSGIFSAVMAGLAASTTYYYKAFAVNAGGKSYSAQRSFTTLSCIVPTVATDTVNITTQYYGAIAGGSIVDTGCSAITAYGIEYSSIGGFTNGKGTKVYSTNAAGNNFTAQLTGLLPNTTYYFKAFAVNTGGTAYGVQDTLKTQPLKEGLIVYSVPVQRGQLLHYSMNSATNAHYQVQLINIVGQVIFSKELVIQVGFIDDSFAVPVGALPGVHTLCITPQGGKRIYKKILIR
ncbi:MAG: lamin tail domain-containing protein [Bacteroidota bacterium]